jgi:hypothetical protein
MKRLLFIIHIFLLTAIKIEAQVRERQGLRPSRSQHCREGIQGGEFM